MLDKISKDKENRIVRSICRACLEDIRLLNKHGYNWIMIKSGFIAHYNLQGFIAHYQYGGALKRAILENQKNNQYGNFSPTDRDYDYCMQQKDIYNRICSILTGKRKIPTESKCYKPTSIVEECKKFEAFSMDCINTAIERYMQVFNCGAFFCGDYSTRAKDLAYATELYNCYESEAKVDDKFYYKEWKFPSGNTGTINSLMKCYGGHLWDIYAELTGQVDEEVEEEERAYNGMLVD